MKKMMLSAFALALSLVTIAGGVEVNETVMTVLPAESNIKWTGKKVTGSHYGTVNVRQGNMVLGSDGKLKSAYVQVDMRTISCDDLTDTETNAKLVGHLKSDDFFGVETHPYAEIKLNDFKSGRDANTYTASGTLTIKGKTEPVSFEFRYRDDGNNAQAMGKLVFDRSKYDVRYGSSSFFDNLGDKVIYNDVELEFTMMAEAKKKK